jgi:hypothetical protein
MGAFRAFITASQVAFRCWFHNRLGDEGEVGTSALKASRRRVGASLKESSGQKDMVPDSERVRLLSWVELVGHRARNAQDEVNEYSSY